MAKKRINIIVDVELYEQFKKVLPIAGDTITSVFHHTMREYIEAINLILETQDKDKLFELMQKKMKDIEVEVDRQIEEKNK